MRRFRRTDTYLFFDRDGEPLVELEAGERVIVETADSICGLAKSTAPRGMHIDDVIKRLGGACPLTGPFYVVGAEAGSALEVDVHRIDPDPPQGEAWTGVFEGFGALQHEPYSLFEETQPEMRLVPYANGLARLQMGGREIAVPMKPFLGTVGVAPLRERRMTFSQSPEYLGDVDVPALAAGATLVLPVNVDGALLGLGDAHGAQGAGEITGAAIEIEAEVELTVRPTTREAAGYVSLPQINTSDRIGSVAGLEGISLTNCARAAYRDLVERLTRANGLRRVEAYELLGQVGRLEIGNMVDPFYSVMASVDRRYVE